jgi:hypothetical protein
MHAPSIISHYQSGDAVVGSTYFTLTGRAKRHRRERTGVENMVGSGSIRTVTGVALIVFTFSSCAHHWTPLTSDEIQASEIDKKSLIDQKVRFHMADGTTEEFTVTDFEEPYVRGYVLKKGIRQRPERSPREVDLRDVVAVELETVNRQRTARTYYLIGLGVLLTVGVLFIIGLSQFE